MLLLQLCFDSCVDLVSDSVPEKRDDRQSVRGDQTKCAVENENAVCPPEYKLCMFAGCDDMLDRSADYVFDSVIQLFCGHDLVDCVDFRRCIDRTCHSGIWCRLEM